MKLLDVYVKLEKEFSSRGFNLYIVGGTSRDMILGRKILDYDFATDATTYEMKEFLDVKSCFNEVGSLTCDFEGTKIDLTTLRKEEDYSDFRHPSKVSFVKTPMEDSKRRDFTLNAIYFDKDGKMIDFYHGLDDIHSRIIRMIGDPYKRIKEDPLRILRALRFSLILDFSLDHELENAISDNAYLLKELTYSKCVNEIKKMMDFNKDKALIILRRFSIDAYIPVEINYSSTPVIDMHCDTITRESIAHEGIYSNEDLHVDIKKMMKSRYMLQCFAVFINIGRTPSPFSQANYYIDLFDKEMEKNKKFITKVTHYSEALKAFNQNKISALLTLEEGAVLEGKIDNLIHFYNRGVRMMSLTWNYPNEIGYPNVRLEANKKPDMTYLETEKGLTKFGIEVVLKMNKLGMIIDVSHLGDAGFYDVIKYSTCPIVASHSNARSIYGVNRNLSDDMIRAIHYKHGLIGINYCPSFLGENEKEDQVIYMVKHIKHIKEITGSVSSIGLGSDYDGIPTPKGMENCGKLYRLEKELIKEGFTKEEIEKIFYKNFLRLLKRICK